MDSKAQTVPAWATGLAYTFLFAQQQAINPGLTPDGFKAWLKATAQEATKAAFAAKGKK